jgi:hypothetical protein
MDTDRTRRRHVREKSVIDHLADKVFEPCNGAHPDGESQQSPTTDTGLPVEQQVRKEWDPQKGGLPIFYPTAAPAN